VISKVDYCCSVLVGISGHQLSRLQSVLNAAARLIFSARRSDRTTPLLRELHWFRIPERIQFRLCVLSYRCLHWTAPSYLADSLRRCDDTEGRRRLRSSVTDTLVVPLKNRSTLGDRVFADFIINVSKVNYKLQYVVNSSEYGFYCINCKHHII